jgi:hypothetical protein
MSTEVSEPVAPGARVDAALGDAKELAAAGDVLAAVDLLHAANTAGRDDRLEKALVDLRFDAFATLGREGRSPWPPSYDDPFPEVVGRLPEIHRDELTTEILGGAIQHHGSLLVRALFSSERTQQLLDDAHHAFRARNARVADGAALEDIAPWYVPFNKGGTPATFGWQYYVRVPDSPPSLFDLVEAYREAGVGDAIAGYLGERPALSSEKCCFRRTPVADLTTNYHQDGRFLGEETRTVNCWVSLSHCGDIRPGLDVLPRRVDHVIETGTLGSAMWWTIAPDKVEEAGEGIEVVRPIFEPGDALMFDQLCIHRTAAELDMQEERFSIECWFFGPSTYPDRDVPVVF